ncbi:MAG: glutamate-5-semialdehyde dehydrogenase [Sulfobacillus acidophilus]|uniref:Gamma-glutamyl phosphate reductase n=1 Tax=Sulfobacillus acidophilus TaxID=53633 RepID=A0A2T2WE13_9FIRM|nr:MAG: glutamate-5-semialdehyde dehydrogenase [Sulfobacillus acidophilus]
MLTEFLTAGRRAQRSLSQVSAADRDQLLIHMAILVESHQDRILEANRIDLTTATQSGLDDARLARLALSPTKLQALAQGLRTVAQLPDPLGRGTRWTLPNGLALEQVRVPMGVIGLIYESRPGVTIEATSLALKSGNAIILRGGREAQQSNQALASLWHQALQHVGIPSEAVQLLTDPDRNLALQLMHLQGLDLLIPRGGSSLIRTVVDEATVPVIETGIGNCHLYVDRQANLEMAVKILLDGKIGNPAVCNALETVLIHRDIKDAFIPQAVKTLEPYGVTWHGDAEVTNLVAQAVLATESDWAEEYLGLHLAARVVADFDEALEHISRYGSGHSEAIVTDHYPTGQQFLKSVDAAVVYWNASTRFSDGHEFGLGAEVGISTQKLHARGPMGLEALTTWKTVAYGDGQTRDF